MSKNFEVLLSEKRDQHKPEPVIFDFTKPEDETRVAELIESGKIQTTIDDYEEQHLELFGVKNPTKVYTPSFKEEFARYYTNLQNERPLHQDGKWVYFPWSCKLVHILNEDDLYHLSEISKIKGNMEKFD